MDFAYFVALAPAFATLFALSLAEGPQAFQRLRAKVVELDEDEVALGLLVHALVHLSTLGVAVVGAMLTGLFHVTVGGPLAYLVAMAWFAMALRLAYRADRARESLLAKHARALRSKWTD